ncbi:MAG: hypothetical protein NZ697_01580 [Porticoccaceae bacterium]|nr:hypothetical protein [Porticoccaceae bacterium]
MRHQFAMSKKISAVVLSLCLLFGFVSWLLLSAQTTQLAEQAVLDRGNSTLGQLNELILAPLFNNDTISVQVALKKATEDPSILSASLFGVDRALIAQSAKPQLQQLKTETFTRNIELQNTQAGIISVVVNSQPIYEQYHRVLTNWLILWLSFTLLSTYLCYRFSDQLTERIRRLSDRLPGSIEQLSDEITTLERKIQPLLSTTGESTLNTSNIYYYSLITANLKNHQRLNNQLNRENLEHLFEKLDYCILRTLQLYGGNRIEGNNDSICFTIGSTHCSKQHLLVCLMAVYSLQQLLEHLSAKLGIDLEINWTISSDNISTAPQFRYEQGIVALKQQNAELADRLQEGLIVLNCDRFSIDELSSIARFQNYDDHCFILEGFPENRQQLLEKQLEHLIGLCL